LALGCVGLPACTWFNEDPFEREALREETSVPEQIDVKLGRFERCRASINPVLEESWNRYQKVVGKRGKIPPRERYFGIERARFRTCAVAFEDGMALEPSMPELESAAKAVRDVAAEFAERTRWHGRHDGDGVIEADPRMERAYERWQQADAFLLAILDRARQVNDPKLLEVLRQGDAELPYLTRALVMRARPLVRCLERQPSPKKNECEPAFEAFEADYSSFAAYVDEHPNDGTFWIDTFTLDAKAFREVSKSRQTERRQAGPSSPRTPRTHPRRPATRRRHAALSLSLRTTHASPRTCTSGTWRCVEAHSFAIGDFRNVNTLFASCSRGIIRSASTFELVSKVSPILRKPSKKRGTWNNRAQAVHRPVRLDSAVPVEGACVPMKKTPQFVALCFTLPFITACGEDSGATSSTGATTFTATGADGDTMASASSEETGDESSGTGSSSDDESGGDATSTDGSSDATDTADASSDATDTTDVTSDATDTTDASSDDSGTTDTTDASSDDSGTTDASSDTTSTTSDTTGSESSTSADDGGATGSTDCQAPPTYVDCDGTPGSLTSDPFQAIGLNCPGGTAENSIQVNNATMNAADANSWKIITGFGTQSGNNYGSLLWAANQDPLMSPEGEEIDPNTSSAVLMLSTGVISPPNAQGVVTEVNGSQEDNGANTNPDGGTLPAPLSAQRGSNNGAGGNPFNDCDGINDCSDSLFDHWVTNGWNNPNDKLWMSFDVDVPAGTFGYVFDFAYFSSEWPDYIGDEFNDLFIAWQVSEVYTGNVTFVNDAPLTITSLDTAGAFQYTGTAAQLAGTGFESHAATGWFTARGAVQENENAQISFFIADMGDDILATAVLLDNFRWECEGCIPSEIDDCGLTPLPE
jgi:hypothetical protein